MFSPDGILCGWLGLKHQLTNFTQLSFIRHSSFFFHTVIHCQSLDTVVFHQPLYAAILNQSFYTAVLHQSLHTVFVMKIIHHQPLYAIFTHFSLSRKLFFISHFILSSFKLFTRLSFISLFPQPFFINLFTQCSSVSWQSSFIRVILHQSASAFFSLFRKSFFHQSLYTSHPSSSLSI